MKVAGLCVLSCVAGSDRGTGLDELRRCTTRWQYALADEVADLVSDIEYDLRERTRAILRRTSTAARVPRPRCAGNEIPPAIVKKTIANVLRIRRLIRVQKR